MTFLKALCIAFSIYSRIPVPQFAWREKEMRWQFLFFPWVGGLIGLLLLLWQFLTVRFGIGQIAFVLMAAAIPLLVTGGFHVDGYMDTMDALKSYGSREEKLRILKDPHIGAFSVIMLAVLGLIYIAAVSQISADVWCSFAGAFFLSRVLSALAVFSFPQAKKDGMLADTSAEGKRVRKTVTAVLLLEGALCAALMIFAHPAGGAAQIGTALCVFVYYRYRSQKEFGGITGDTAGWFVCITETAMAAAAAVVSTVL